MSVESLTIALHHSQAKGTDKLVLLGIANHEGDGGAWPSIATLARYANVSERAVQKSITRLIELGELSRDIKAGGTTRTPEHSRPNRFEVTLTCPPGCDRTAAHRVVETVETVSEPVDKGGEPEFTPRTTVHQGGEPQFTRVVNHSSPQEPSINTTINTSKTFVGNHRTRECSDCGQLRAEEQLTGSGICFNCLPEPTGRSPDIGSGYAHFQAIKNQLYGKRATPC